MNGDEDLGQDITMKGEKFHWKTLQQNQLKELQEQKKVGSQLFIL
jgi:hypothetical protein